MWAFRKKPDSLSEEEQEVLKRLFEYSPELERVYDLREKLTSNFLMPTDACG
jgi:Na+/phosphate symporter